MRTDIHELEEKHRRLRSPAPVHPDTVASGDERARNTQQTGRAKYRSARCRPVLVLPKSRTGAQPPDERISTSKELGLFQGILHAFPTGIRLLAFRWSILYQVVGLGGLARTVFQRRKPHLSFRGLRSAQFFILSASSVLSAVNSLFGFRASDFFRASDLGFRISVRGSHLSALPSHLHAPAVPN